MKEPGGVCQRARRGRPFVDRRMYNGSSTVASTAGNEAREGQDGGTPQRGDGVPATVNRGRALHRRSSEEQQPSTDLVSDQTHGNTVATQTDFVETTGQEGVLTPIVESGDPSGGKETADSPPMDNPNSQDSKDASDLDLVIDVAEEDKQEQKTSPNVSSGEKRPMETDVKSLKEQKYSHGPGGLKRYNSIGIENREYVRIIRNRTKIARDPSSSESSTDSQESESDKSEDAEIKGDDGTVPALNVKEEPVD